MPLKGSIEAAHVGKTAGEGYLANGRVTGIRCLNALAAQFQTPQANPLGHGQTLSFEDLAQVAGSQDLLNDWTWSERFPAQPEIKRYLQHVADRFDLYRDIELNTRVESATWQDDTERWHVRTDQGELFDVRYLISCVGMLSSPKAPSFPGREQFQGQVYQTARWPQTEIDFSGQRVGVVGPGATGIQVVQTLASEVDELFVFQRKPQYAVRMNNYPVDAAIMQTWRAQYPVLQELVRDKIRAQIDDPAVAAKLVPGDYGYGLHRVPLENGYFEAFNRDNVHLVDVKETPITGYSRGGLMVGDREYALDALVLATGFDAGTGSLTRMNIRGRGGCSLSELWDRDIRSALGLQVHGFPNLYTVAGPLAPATGFCNMTTCLQQQVDWITDAIVFLRDQGKHTMEPTQEREEAWVQHHDEVANSTLLMSVDSWYNGANIEGKPRRLLSYIGGVEAYRDLCDEIRTNGYPGFAVA